MASRASDEIVAKYRLKFLAVCISRECWEMPGNAGKFFKLAKIGVFSAVDYLSSIIIPFNNISMYVYK